MAESRISIDLEKVSLRVNILVPLFAVIFLALGYIFSSYFYLLAAILFILTGLNFYYRHIQKKHTLLRNFGLIALLRYFIEGVGPEFRQYLYSSDTEETPFNRVERSEVYRKSKGVDSSSSFGSQLSFSPGEKKLKHSMFPSQLKDLKDFELTFGEERGIKNTYTLKQPVIVSAMSYGALGQSAVRSISRGAAATQTLVNTGEGGLPKYHLMEGADLIFQMGTAKFGVRNDDASLNDEKLTKLVQESQIKMIEIKLSQGAKPGKGGILPKEKITKEISELRGVPQGKDVLSPSCHVECRDHKTLVEFIKRVQDVSGIPVGIKLCVGHKAEFLELVQMMKSQDIFPDFISVDGGEGGTGAAPKSFMDDVGRPLYDGLRIVDSTLKSEGVRDRLKILAAGKLINASEQFFALCLGADAVYTARGFMLAIGCIQALQCNANTCPVGITTHKSHLQRGLNVQDKSIRVQNYVESLRKDHKALLCAMGLNCITELNENHIVEVSI